MTAKLKVDPATIAHSRPLRDMQPGCWLVAGHGDEDMQWWRVVAWCRYDHKTIKGKARVKIRIVNLDGEVTEFYHDQYYVLPMTLNAAEARRTVLAEEG